MLMKIFYSRKEKTNSVSVRKREEGNLGSMPIKQLLEILQSEREL